MTKLEQLFLAVKEENLTKDQLEDLHMKFSHLYGDMHIQMAELEKKKALFMLNDPEKTNALMERLWSGSEDGLRQIELRSYIRATSAHLKSLRSRLYSQY